MRLASFFLILATVLVLPGWATAQGSYCLTQQAQCAISGRHLPGSPCRCPQSATATGVTVLMDSDDPYRAAPQRRDRYELRNDDIDADDDLLAGPRHHYRRDKDLMRQGG